VATGNSFRLVQAHLILHLDFRADKDCPVHLFLALQAIFQAAIDRYPGITAAKLVDRMEHEHIAPWIHSDAIAGPQTAYP
jgi:hypothetical protein